MRAMVLLLTGVGLVSVGCSAQPAGEPRGPLPTPTPVTATATPNSATVAPIATPPLSIGDITGQALPTPPPDTVWVRVADPSAPVTYEVPSTYGYSAVFPWQENGTEMGVLLAAGANPSQIGTDFSAPGVLIGASANPIGMTPMTLVTEDDYSDRCTATAAQAGAEPNVTSAFRTWESCGASRTGYLMLLGIVPQDGRGLIGIVLQGASDADLAYVQHIVESLKATGGTGETPAPGATPQPVGTPASGQPYTITMDICQNQHGQGIAEGELTNSDSVPHTYRILVEFWQQGANTKLNDTRSFAYNLDPGVTQRWQAVVPSGLPSVDVECRVKAVEVS
jgi:hypothetical protein